MTDHFETGKAVLRVWLGALDSEFKGEDWAGRIIPVDEAGRRKRILERLGTAVDHFDRVKFVLPHDLQHEVEEVANEAGLSPEWVLRAALRISLHSPDLREMVEKVARERSKL